MKALLFAESCASVLELATAARKMGADQIAQIAFGSGMCSAADDLYEINLPEGSARENAYPSIKAWFDTQDADIVLAQPTYRMKAIVGRLAASCKATAIGNINSIEDGVATSLYFGGIANKQAKPLTDVAFYYVGTGIFEPAESGTADIHQMPWVEPASPIQVTSCTRIEKSGTDLSAADVVIACGRGFAEKEQLDDVFKMADKIGACVGCSRPLTEAVDWFERDAYIGVSGQMLKPKVYIGLGISGQMQHMIGVNTADVIVAVNKDKDAPIFTQCDYGMVGDLKEVVPALLAAL